MGVEWRPLFNNFPQVTHSLGYTSNFSGMSHVHLVQYIVHANWSPPSSVHVIHFYGLLSDTLPPVGEMKHFNEKDGLIKNRLSDTGDPDDGCPQDSSHM